MYGHWSIKNSHSIDLEAVFREELDPTATGHEDKLAPLINTRFNKTEDLFSQDYGDDSSAGAGTGFVESVFCRVSPFILMLKTEIEMKMKQMLQ